MPAQTDVDLGALERRIEMLEDLVATLCRSVSYLDDEPYGAAVCRYGIGGPTRVVLDLVIAAVLDRASAEFALTRPNPRHLDHPALDQAFVREPVTRDEALRLIALVVGDVDQAAVLLDAHCARGLGSKGHQALRR